MNKQLDKNKPDFGFYISLFGTVLILLWLGIFKFTPTEAAAIKLLVINHPLSGWLYNFFSDQEISNFVGTFEIFVAILLIIGLYKKLIAKIASILLIVIFLTTISYLFTTPNIWKVVNEIPITDFFIIKDIMYLGFGVSYFIYSNNKTK